MEEALEYIKNNPQYKLYSERFDAFSEQENMLHFESSDDVAMNDVTNEANMLLDEPVASTSSLLISAWYQLNE